MQRLDQQGEKLDEIGRQIKRQKTLPTPTSAVLGIYDKIEIKDNYLVHFSQSLPNSSSTSKVAYVTNIGFVNQNNYM